MSTWGDGREAGDAAQVAGIVVDDLEDVDQVSAIPAMPGLSFRGGSADWWEDGASYTEAGWLRTSRDPLVGTGNFAGDRAVGVLGPGGRDVATLSGHPAEQETVFLPGSRFTVLRQGALAGLWVSVVYVHRGDEDAPDDADAQVGRVASVLARARTLPAAVLARPDRFTGEFGTRR